MGRVRGGTEAVCFVKCGCPIVDRMRSYRARARDFRGSHTAMNGVRKKVSAKAAALEFLAHGKATDKKKRDAVWQTLVQLRCR